MCEYVSFVCTTEGPLSIYVSPTMTSHGDARLGWKLTGGAEAEWTGENHDSLTVRFEDKEVARTIRQMLVEKFQSRTELIYSITESRDSECNPVFLKHGRRVFVEAEAGPNFEELNDLLEALPTLHHSSPTTECSEEILEQLVAQHLFELGTYCKYPSQFDGVTLKIVRDHAARAAARDAAWDAARDALKQTKTELQVSAVALVERMIAARDEDQAEVA